MNNIYNRMKRFESDFDRSFNRTKRFINVMMFLIFGSIVAYILFVGSFFVKAKSEGKAVYTIEVLSYQGTHFYHSDSIISQSPNMVVFVDMIGREQTISGENIVVTKY